MFANEATRSDQINKINSMTGTGILVITTIPSPYHVEYFDAIASRTRLRAAYLTSGDRTRNWGFVRPRHEYLLFEEADDAPLRLSRWVDQADLVVFSGYKTGIMRSAMARRVAAGLPWCFWGERLGFHGLGLVGTASRRFLMRSVHRSRAPIWAIGAWAIESYRREFGPARHYFNIPYCSDLRRFRIAADQRERIKVVRFLYSGSLIFRKGVDLLCGAFTRLAQKCAHVHLTIVGHGPLRAQMETSLAAVSDRVVFVGPVEWGKLPEHYALADFLCAPSRYDGWGLIVPEGLASGLPIIATDRMGSAAEIIRPGKNGWKVRQGDEDALYRAMLEAAAMDSAKWREMSDSARSSAEPYDLAAGTDRFLTAACASLNSNGQVPVK